MFQTLKIRRFFKSAEKEKIIETIGRAEKCTSGEIRVHVESITGKDVVLRAKEVFETMGMTQTELRNGVLIYLAIKDRKFAIIGDRGIDEVVPANFWDKTKDKMQELFKEGRFADGVCYGIDSAGEHLAKYFPCRADDVNELPDEISVGK